MQKYIQQQILAIYKFAYFAEEKKISDLLLALHFISCLVLYCFVVQCIVVV